MINLQLALYRHNKSGNYYLKIGEGTHTETQELFVIYVAASKERSQSGFWLRPKKMFEEMLELDGKQSPRFGRIIHPDIERAFTEYFQKVTTTSIFLQEIIYCMLR